MIKKRNVKEKIVSDKILRVDFLEEEVGYYYWDGKRVSLIIQTEDTSSQCILESILNKEEFFNPKTESHEHTDARHDFELFLIKSVPELFKYAFSYEIIDLKFSSRVTYMFITEFNDGTIIEDLALNCKYNKNEQIISFWCGERSRMLNVIRILKNRKDEFEFIDGNGFKIILYPVTIEDYKKYRNSLFINAPTLNTDEDIQDWLMSIH